MNRRRLLAAGAALWLPGAAAAAPLFARSRPAACHGRAAYAGGPLHPGIAAADLQAAAQAGAVRATPYASDDLDARLKKAAGGARTYTAAIARSDGTTWNDTSPGAAPAGFTWPGLADVYLATVALQLVEAGKLALEAPIERWAPELPTARWITLEDLIGHTGGLADPAAGQTAPAAPFCPGAGWSAPAADYRLLARIVEAVDGRPAAEAVKTRILDTLELKETRLPAGATGELSASASDVVRFWRALMAGRLHSAEMTRRRFLRLYPMTAPPARSYWGLGVMATDLAADAWNPAETWLGHAAAAPGAAGTVAWSPRRRAFAALALTGEGSAEAALDLMWLGVPPQPVNAAAPPPFERAPPRRRRKRRSAPRR